jgi:hypothetical protein
MSQREKSGESWPRFSVGAGEPFEVGPKPKRACISGRKFSISLGTIPAAASACCSSESADMLSCRFIALVPVRVAATRGVAQLARAASVSVVPECRPLSVE